MEASGAGLASGDAVQAQGDGQGQQQGQGQDGQQQQGQQLTGDAAIARLTEQLAGVASGQEEMRQYLETFGQQQQSQAEQASQAQQQQEQPKPPDLSFLNDPRLGQEEAAERLQTVMRGEAGAEAQRLMQEAIAPIQDAVDNLRLERETDALVAEFPDLGKPDVAQSVLATAQQAAEAMQQPELATKPGFVRMVYMAGRAAELAQKQQGAADGSGVATLEGAGGASPGGAAQGASQTENFAEKWARGTDVLSKL